MRNQEVRWGGETAHIWPAVRNPGFYEIMVIDPVPPRGGAKGGGGVTTLRRPTSWWGVKQHMDYLGCDLAGAVIETFAADLVDLEQIRREAA